MTLFNVHSLLIILFQTTYTISLEMEDEVMRFEITDQDLEEEMSTSYGKRR